VNKKCHHDEKVLQTSTPTQALVKSENHWHFIEWNSCLIV